MHDDKFTKGMRGEFRGDFTRDTFDPLRHFSRVLMQQGRVQLDADKNESDSIHLYHLRTLATDLIGPHGTPTKLDGDPGDGFKININADKSNFSIMPGHYYVDGILCENDKEDITYLNQPSLPLTESELENPLPKDDGYLVYLDVWERHLSYVEDDYIREKALGGVDTASRAQIVWQVKVVSHKQLGGNIDNPEEFKTDHKSFLRALMNVGEKRPGTGLLKARARKAADDNKDPCLTSPEASYRGAENQLYRVEIHKSSVNNIHPTFKWSRENASVIFPVTEISGDGKIITLENLGRDCRFGLKANDWVEIVDDDYTLRNRADSLLQIEDVDTENLQVTLKSEPDFPDQFDETKHRYLRRWDQTGENLKNGILVSPEADWIPLEDGVEIQFPTPETDPETGNENEGYVYHTGDYWLIPARTATGDVEWPGTPDAPHAMPSQGVDHHYAPLAIISDAGTANTSSSKKNAKKKSAVVVKDSHSTNLDLRRLLRKLWE